MEDTKHTGLRCPVRTALELVGGKWKLLLLYQLAEGALRYTDLRKRLPEVSDKVLAQQLQILTQDLLVSRLEYPSVTPRVEYSLTDRGRLALPLIGELVSFAQAYEK